MSKRPQLLIILTALSLIVSSQVSAQTQSDVFNRRFSQDFNYNWDFYGGGARAMAMGNAYTAMSGDEFSLGWNPAGLVSVSDEKVHIGFDWSNFTPRGGYSYDSSPANFDHTGGSSNFFRNFSFTGPFRIKQREMAIGLALTRVFDTYDYFVDEIFPHPSSTPSPDVTYERSGYLNSANFGLSSRAGDNLTLGLSMNVYFGKVLVEHNRIEAYDNQIDTSNLFQVSNEEYLVNELDSFNLKGFNVTLGGMYDIDENNHIGISLRTPFKMNFSNDVTITRTALGNGADIPNDGGFAGVRIFANKDSKVEMPLMIRFGFVRNWSEKLTTSLDIDSRSYRGSKFFILDADTTSASGNKESFFHEEESNWNSALQLRFGAEYVLESKIGDIPLRMGLGYLPQAFGDISNYNFEYSGRNFPLMPQFVAGNDSTFVGSRFVVNSNQDIDLFIDNTGSQITATSISFGIGINSPQRSLDIAYSYTTYTQTVNTDQALGLDSAYDPRVDDPVSNLVSESRFSETKVQDHRFMITFTGYF